MGGHKSSASKIRSKKRIINYTIQKIQQRILKDTKFKVEVISESRGVERLQFSNYNNINNSVQLSTSEEKVHFEGLSVGLKRLEIDKYTTEKVTKITKLMLEYTGWVEICDELNKLEIESEDIVELSKLFKKLKCTE